MRMVPETRYARLGELHLAYQVVGEGPPDVLLLDQWFGHVDAQWDVPPVAELRERLAAFGRLIMFDKRGTGLSDPGAFAALESSCSDRATDSFRFSEVTGWVMTAPSSRGRSGTRRT